MQHQCEIWIVLCLENSGLPLKKGEFKMRKGHKNGELVLFQCSLVIMILWFFSFFEILIIWQRHLVCSNRYLLLIDISCNVKSVIILNWNPKLFLASATAPQPQWELPFWWAPDGNYLKWIPQILPFFLTVAKFISRKHRTELRNMVVLVTGTKCLLMNSSNGVRRWRKVLPVWH